MGFNSGKALTRLDYDLSAHMPGVVGEVPEPSQDLRTEFIEQLQDAVGEERGTDASDSVGKIARMSHEEQRKVLEDLRQAFVRLCAGSPNAQQIVDMPARVYDAFTGWLMGELFPQSGQQSATPR